MGEYERINRIEKALNIRDMKQSELCEKTGVNKSSLSNWIKQNWQPKQEALYKMAKALNVSEMWLAGYDVPMERPKASVQADKTLEYAGKLKALSPEQQALVFSLIDQLGGN